MSTILDALRKAQDETGEGRSSRPMPQPEDGPPGRPPRRARSRRLPGWLLTTVAVLLIAVVGGFALGPGLGVLSGDEAATTDEARTARADARDAAPPEVGAASAPAGLPRSGAPDRSEGEPGVAPEDRRLANAERARPPARPEQRAAGTAAPGGTLEVVRAKKRPGKPKGEDRAERLRRMRERLAEARLKAAERQGQPTRPPIAITVPPANEQDPPAAAAAAAAAANGGVGPAPVVPAPSQVASAERPPPAPEVAGDVAQDGRAVGPERNRAPATDPRPGPALGAATLGGRGDVAPATEAAPAARAARVAPPPAEPAAAVPAPQPEAPAPEPASAPEPAPVPEQASAPEPASVAPVHRTAAVADGGVEPPPVALASLPAEIPPPPQAEPQILRRTPGGAPQVAINILQWSAEPTRRFAFVSVDGGGMTRVREGDRIGGLTVKRIYEQMIEFGFNESSFLLRAN